VYEKHNQEVIDYFSNQIDKLLVANWQEKNSWDNLCQFLNKEIPNAAFPHANKTSKVRIKSLFKKLKI